MAAALRYDWEAIRAEYEAGATMGELSRKYGVNKGGISQRAKKEGWLQDVSGAVDRLAEAKLNGVLNTLNPQKKAEAMEAAAERKAAVQLQLRADCDLFRAKYVDPVLTAEEPEKLAPLAKTGKTISDMMKSFHELVRKAWGISDVLETRSTVDATQTITIDGANMDRAGIEALVDQAYRLEAVK